MFISSTHYIPLEIKWSIDFIDEIINGIRSHTCFSKLDISWQRYSSPTPQEDGGLFQEALVLSDILSNIQDGGERKFTEA